MTVRDDYSYGGPTKPAPIKVKPQSEIRSLLFLLKTYVHGEKFVPYQTPRKVIHLKSTLNLFQLKDTHHSSLTEHSFSSFHKHCIHLPFLLYAKVNF